jgi:transposase
MHVHFNDRCPAGTRERAACKQRHWDSGCKWRSLPDDFPPWRTVWGFMARWAAAGVIGQIRDHLAGRIRREMGKGPPGGGHRDRLTAAARPATPQAA